MDNNEKWRGATTKIDTPLNKVDGFGFGAKPFGLDEVAASPWLAIYRQWCWRFGPMAWPLPGFGSFVQNVTDDEAATTTKLHIAILPLKGVPSQGIYVSDIHQFLDTESGLQYCREAMTIISLRVGDVCWVPYGSIALPIFSHDADDKLKGDKKTKVEEAMKVVGEWNAQHFDKMIASPTQAVLWYPRAELVNKFMKGVDQTS